MGRPARTALSKLAAAIQVALAGTGGPAHAAPAAPLPDPAGLRGPLLYLEHEGQILSLSFSADGALLASATGSGSVRIWDGRTGELRRRLETGGDGTGGWTRLSPDGRTLAVVAPQAVALWDVQTAKLRRNLSLGENSGRAMALAFSPDGRLLACGGDPGATGLAAPGYAWVWDVETGALRHLLRHEGGLEVISLAFSPDGKALATGSQGNSVCLWDVGTGALVRRIPFATESANGYTWALAFSPDGRLLAGGGMSTGAGGGTGELGKWAVVKTWDAATGGVAHTFHDTGQIVTGVAFFPDGKALLTGGYDGTVKLWDTATGALRDTLSVGIEVQSLALAADGRRAAFGGRGKKGTLALWAPRSP